MVSLRTIAVGSSGAGVAAAAGMWAWSPLTAILVAVAAAASAGLCEVASRRTCDACHDSSEVIRTFDHFGRDYLCAGCFRKRLHPADPLEQASRATSDDESDGDICMVCVGHGQFGGPAAMPCDNCDGTGYTDK